MREAPLRTGHWCCRWQLLQQPGLGEIEINWVCRLVWSSAHRYTVYGILSLRHTLSLKLLTVRWVVYFGCCQCCWCFSSTLSHCFIIIIFCLAHILGLFMCRTTFHQSLCPVWCVVFLACATRPPNQSLGLFTAYNSRATCTSTLDMLLLQTCYFFHYTLTK